MVFRYRLRELQSNIDTIELFKDLHKTKIDGSKHYSLSQWSAVVAHFAAVGAVTLLVQDGVRDQDFLEEFEAFYARQHRPVSRYCMRVHAFSFPIDSTSIIDEPEISVLQFIDSAPPSAYLGFTTIRPLRHAPVGPTIIVDSPNARSSVKDEFPVHIAGVSFCVMGTPFMQQDSSVGACAQASIWMSLRTLRRRAGTSAYSPAQLTLAATKIDRVLPGRRGLNVGQMLDAIRHAGHDPLAIEFPRLDEATPVSPYEILDSIRPYIESGIPVILILKKPQTEGHAMVALGMSLQSGTENGLIVHNDDAGPYQSLLIENDATEAYLVEHTTKLIVPLPSGLAMSAAEAYTQANTVMTSEPWLEAFREYACRSDSDKKLPDFAKSKLRIYLCPRHTFRRWARDCTALSPSIRQLYRTKELPRHVWVVEIHLAAIFTHDLLSPTRVGEIVIDAAADALHGDGVLFMRFTKHMFLDVDRFDLGSVLIDDSKSVMMSNEGELSLGLASPWMEGVVL